MDSREGIKTYGLFASIVVTIVGVGIFSYPKEITQIVGNDGWIVTILSGLICLFLMHIIYKVVKINDFKDFNDIVTDNLGKFIGFITLLIFAIYTIFLSAIQMRVFVEVIKMYLLEKTPTEFLLFITILSGAYIMRFGVKNLVKFNEIAFVIMFTSMLLALIVVSKGADFTRILPVLQNKPMDYITGVYQSVLTFAGFEIGFLLFPLCSDKNKKNKPAYKAIIFSTIFYVVITIFSISVLSREETKIITWPTITMITSIDLPGLFVERWEGVIMALWILFYFTTFTNLTYFGSDIIKNSFKLGDIKISLLLIIPIIYIVALYPKNIAELYFAARMFIRGLIVINVLVLPILLYTISKVKLKIKRSR